MKEQLQLVRIFNAALLFDWFWKAKLLSKQNFIQKIKDGASTINFLDKKSIATYWIALYLNGDNVTYFDGFGVE